MADTTGAPYNLPYQEVGDAPHGPNGFEDLATAVHSALATIDAKIATLNALSNAFASSSADEVGYTSSTYAAGGTTVGTTFVAPASGSVKVDFSAYLQNTINAGATIQSFEMKIGGTIGSGTLVGSAANSDRAIICGKAVVASGPSIGHSGNWAIYTGLTPGATYNVRMMHAVDGGTGSTFYRQILVQPQL